MKSFREKVLWIILLEKLHELGTWQVTLYPDLLLKKKRLSIGWPWIGGLKSLKETDLTNLST